jgi:hypothetical protein
MLLRWLHWPLDTALLVLGRLMGWLQVLLRLEPKGRGLTPEERALFEDIFQGSVRLDPVIIKEGRIGILGITGRAFTLGNWIYSPGPLSRDVLLHELVHVWQFQQEGRGYITRAIWAQWLGGGYDHITPRKKGRTFRQLNPEQQAQWVQDLLRQNRLFTEEGRAVLEALRRNV